MIIIYSFLVFLSICGLFSIMRTLSIRFLRVKGSGCKSYLLLRISEPDSGDIAFETGLAISRLRWLYSHQLDGVVITDCGLCEKNRELCRKICASSGFELIDEQNLEFRCSP